VFDSVLLEDVVVRFLRNQRTAVSVETIQAYLDHLSAACLLHPVRRWDIRGKAHLALGEKYYLGDIGLFTAILGGPADVNAVLENLVYLELRRRGAQVSSGRDGDLEVDFVAQRAGECLYVQVGGLVGAPETRERETRALEGIRDHHPKVVLSVDPLPIALPNGLRHVDLRRFLAGERLHPGGWA
jgi:predicted AAA+ superfamily ATPase